jgi:hypothetical protein
MRVGFADVRLQDVNLHLGWGEGFMRRKLMLSGAAAVLFICRPVMAQTVPVLSGKYATTYNEICQAGTNTTSASAGATYNQILVADFDNVSKTVKVTGTSVSGALVAVNGESTRLTQTAIDAMYPYSNTATTITIGSHTFNALYGPLILGTPQWALFGGISSDNCSASAVAIRQSPLSVSPPVR